MRKYAVVIEVSGGRVTKVTAEVPTVVAILDADTDGADPDQLMHIVSPEGDGWFHSSLTEAAVLPNHTRWICRLIREAEERRQADDNT